MFKPGDKVLHEYNRELGPGVVESVAGGRMRVHFPRSGDTLVFSLKEPAFRVLDFPAEITPAEWGDALAGELEERLLHGDLDPASAFLNRIRSFDLARLREADGLGSFLGGRIRIFPHQLHVASTAAAADPVRWLLADEVGLGKTIEACLVLSRLRRTGRAQRVLVIAPSTLTVQWLGELYRKFHEVFVLLDRELTPEGARTSAGRDDVFEDRGDDYNPFNSHLGTILSLEDLIANPRAVALAVAAAPDLLVVDEAHRLERDPGTPGNAAYQAVAPIARASRHVLFLSATPLEADVRGFYALLALLWPKAYPSWKEFSARLESGEPLWPCTSATRRADIGGLPPRVARPVDLPGWNGGNALEPKDPRLEWILAQARGEWRRRREKVLVFVAGQEALEEIHREIEFAIQARVAVFHAGLSSAQRDIQVAQFAQSAGAGILLSTEAGGEGRNFEFCRRLVLFDLPWNPTVVEQRIGRLDRIGRRWPVEIVYFRPLAGSGASGGTGGLGAQVVALYEALGLFSEPLGTLEQSLAHVEAAIRAAAESGAQALDIPAIIAETAERKQAVNRAIYHHLHQNRYRPEMASAILARLPAELDRLTEDVVVAACERYGFQVVEHPEEKSWYFEFGEESVVEGLPGLVEGSRWLGTFERETAVAREAIDFFASGHPFVEGVLSELEDTRAGQVASLTATGTGLRAAGLVAAVRRARGEPIVVRIWDDSGVEHPEWQPLLFGARARVRDGIRDRVRAAGWAERVRAVAGTARAGGELMALAAFVLEP
jgi:ATP-dependent helicase HepA